MGIRFRIAKQQRVYSPQYNCSTSMVTGGKNTVAIDSMASDALNVGRKSNILYFTLRNLIILGKLLSTFQYSAGKAN